MFPESFEYHAPASLQDAVALLAQHGDDAKVLAGGMSLIPIMKLRLAAPAHVIDLRKVGELKGVTESGGNLVIGAGTTYRELESSPLVRDKCPLVAQAAAAVGDVQVRNRGTIGGSMVHNDPAADMPAALVALDAQFTLMGQKERTVGVHEFLVDSLATAIEADEILVRIAVPTTTRTAAYRKMAQQASGYAMVGVAVALEMQGGTCNAARVGVTGVSPVAFRATSVEQALMGKQLDGTAISAAAQAVAADAKNPLADPLNASAEYRVHLAQVYTRRVIEAALG